MEDPADSRIDKTSNLVSRNRPVALVVNACGFIASHMVDFLLEKDIQVIGIDDLSISNKKNIEGAVKNKDFHLLNAAIDKDEVLEKAASLDLPRIDYGFFITDKSVPDITLGKGIINFITLADEFKKKTAGEKNSNKFERPKLVFSSSINLYGKVVSGRDRILKEAEAKFARGIRHFKLNGRVVRLSEVFGPGMEIEEENPIFALIAAAINDKLSDEKISLTFTERSLFIDDAVKLLAKSAFSGSTSNKIYDGALLHPIRLSEIKQILINPVWSEENAPEFTKLPAWPTPNLLKTMKELSWAPKTSMIKALRETVAYFKERQDLLPKEKQERLAPSKSWSFEGSGFLKSEEEEGRSEEKTEKSREGKEDKQSLRSEDLKEGRRREGNLDSEFDKETRKTFGWRVKRTFLILFLGAILVYGLIWPLIFLGYQGFSAREHIISSKDNFEKGKFPEAETEIQEASLNLSEYKNVLDSAGILRRVPGVKDVIEKADKIVNLAQEGTEGILYATRGSKSLFETTRIISGESREDPGKYYDDAQKDLKFASSKLSKVYANLGEKGLKEGMPEFMSEKLDDLRLRLGAYQTLVEQAKTASMLMPEITALGGKKSYLILLQNNLELRPTGGFIGSYAKLDFEDGRLKEIKVDDVYNLDGALKEVIAPTQELKSDLGIERLYLRDSNYDPDFPSSARQASFFYRKEAGESVQGVIALDLKASGNLLDAVGGLDLPEYGEQVNGTNLFEKAISHAETNFFPGSQAKKNYLTSLQTQLFNKIFYLSKQNWPAIIEAIGKSLNEKHMMVYLEDPNLFSYLASSNWSGVFPRGSEKREGETNDFLAVIESNMGANKANYYLQRKLTINASFTKEGKVMHQLKINYKNTSPSDIFPAGTYKNRIKIYAPLGSKITKAVFGEIDILTHFVPFSDYGRSGFSSLIQVAPKEQKNLIFEYELADPLSFTENLAVYRIEVFKQPGTMSDPLDFSLTYPINYKLAEKPEQGSTGVQEVRIATDMQTDRVFEFIINK